ncbi:polysaccharide deacetylase family sporulation protein PdaB [Keratinibaculum paraultunense]|uniref:Polysaccharide deacetylase family sporulation protein PdaB n=1 Tax=Keratinibaculum paraultunense TaxID=1278232 RepID=A0A4R3KYG2_9FIRM|nr:polysaccharide deacetylase family sporulation protein PdaB [Keratinibaculum paraultunense]TCS90878.1 polysaccharide deacetylase family sporulation protein PdaB [Keratinibaculum paraultunense]
MNKEYKRNHIIFRILVVIFLVIISIIYTGIKSNINISEVFSYKKELPIYSVETEEKKVAITFDASWGDDHTLDILDILDKYNVKSTFFLVGFWVDKYPEHVKEIYNRGHDVGNHSTNHPYMTKLSDEEIVKEINITEDKIEKIINEKPILFRAPFGDYDDRVINLCKENGYYVIQWDVDSLDWKEMGVQPVVDRVIRNVRNGSIILFHNNAKYVSEYLPIVIERLQNEGYEIVPVSQLIYKDNFYMDNTGRQIQKNDE